MSSMAKGVVTMTAAASAVNNPLRASVVAEGCGELLFMANSGVSNSNLMLVLYDNNQQVTSVDYTILGTTIQRFSF